MRGPIYNYDEQCWTWIDTDTDQRLGDFRFQTPDGVAYELCPNDPKKYRNCETEASLKE